MLAGEQWLAVGMPGDAVQQAFVKALLKPDDERVSIHDEKKFVAWMCEMAKYEALTNRQSSVRQAKREVIPERDVADLVGIAPSAGAVEARKMLREAFVALKPADQALLYALYVDGETIDEIAKAKGVPWTTMQSRHQRVLKRLYAAIHTTIAALVLLVPRKARAFVAHVKQQLPQVFAQAGGVLTVGLACGVLLPASSSVTTECAPSASLARASTPPTALAQLAHLGPSFITHVAPEEPNKLDTETNECSAADMKCNNMARRFAETLVPLSLLVAPALTQVACAGTQQQTPPPQEPEDEREGGYTAYEVYCLIQRRDRRPCPTEEEWERQLGLRK